jgi:hypothetical protein
MGNESPEIMKEDTMAEVRSSRRLKAGAFAGLAVICVAALLAYFVWAGKIARGTPTCEVCKRVIHAETSFKIARPDGSMESTCCPRCGLTAVIQNGGRALEAVDFMSKKPIRATVAIYLEGSDIMECCSTTGFRSDEGGYQEMDYDRCMPSLIAFSRREDAETVRQTHGGRIISFEEAMQSVVNQLKSH